MLEQTENVVYNRPTGISLPFANETPVKTKTLQLQMLAASSYALAIMLPMTTKITANINYGLSCTWLGKRQIAQQLVRRSLLCRVWETDLHGWKLIWLVLMCTEYKKRFPKVASSMQIVCYPSQGAKVFRAQFHQVSVGWMQDMRGRG